MGFSKWFFKKRKARKALNDYRIRAHPTEEHLLIFLERLELLNEKNQGKMLSDHEEAWGKNVLFLTVENQPHLIDHLLTFIARLPQKKQAEIFLYDHHHYIFSKLNNVLCYALKQRSCTPLLLEVISAWSLELKSRILSTPESSSSTLGESMNALHMAVRYQPEMVPQLLSMILELPQRIQINLVSHRANYDHEDRSRYATRNALEEALISNPEMFPLLMDLISTFPILKQIEILNQKGERLSAVFSAIKLIERSSSPEVLETFRRYPISEFLLRSSKIQKAVSRILEREAERVRVRRQTVSRILEETSHHAVEPSAPPRPEPFVEPSAPEIPASSSLQFFDSSPKRLNNNDIMDALNRKGISYDELCEYAESQEKKWQALCCPITHNPFIDPVILGNTGHTFEREAIEAALTRNPNRDPLTNDAISDSKLASNYAVRDVILQQIEEMPDKKLLAEAIGL